MVFNSNITHHIISLQLIDDLIFELTKNLQATLSFPGENALAEPVILDPDLVNITIVDDESKMCLKQFLLLASSLGPLFLNFFTQRHVIPHTLPEYRCRVGINFNRVG